jgi:hypothetical protein
LNGAVGQCNGAWRYEFYAVYDLPRSVDAINPILDSFQHLYNHHMPYGALGGITPFLYLANRPAESDDVFWGVIGSNSTLVVAEGHAHDTVQTA